MVPRWWLAAGSRQNVSWTPNWAQLKGVLPHSWRRQKGGVHTPGSLSFCDFVPNDAKTKLVCGPRRLYGDVPELAWIALDCLSLKGRIALYGWGRYNPCLRTGDFVPFILFGDNQTLGSL